MGIARPLAGEDCDDEGEERPDSWRPSSDEEEDELLTPAGAASSRPGKSLSSKQCTGLAVCGVAIALVSVLAVPGGSPGPRGGARRGEEASPSPVEGPQQSRQPRQQQADRRDAGSLGAVTPPQAVKLCTYDNSTQYCPTSELWLSPEVQDNVARDIMSAPGQQLFIDTDRELVLAKVKFEFERFSSQLALLDPTVEKELSMVEVNEAERSALLTALRLLNDPRVQDVGRDVGVAIRHSVHLNTDRDFLKESLESALLERFEDLRRLRREVVPEALQKLWGQNEPERLPALATSKWRMTLEPANIESMTPTDQKPVLVEVSSLQPADKVNVVEGAALVEGRYLLDVLLTCVKWLRPTWSTDLLGSLDFARTQLSQHCDPDPPEATRGKINLAQVVLCKLKFGAQGMDALRADFIAEMMRNSTSERSRERRQSNG